MWRWLYLVFKILSSQFTQGLPYVLLLLKEHVLHYVEQVSELVFISSHVLTLLCSYEWIKHVTTECWGCPKLNIENIQMLKAEKINNVRVFMYKVTRINKLGRRGDKRCFKYFKDLPRMDESWLQKLTKTLNVQHCLCQIQFTPSIHLPKHFPRMLLDMTSDLHTMVFYQP